jgi:hypothetical protein
MPTVQPESDHHKEHWLELRIFAPRDPEERTFVFDREVHVGVAAEQVAKEFGYAPGTHSFQTRDDVVLERASTLEAAHVHDHELLELVDAGGGV